MASMLEKLGAMFEEGADTTSVSISADVSVSEGTDTEVVETVDEVQDYVEASDEVEAATQEVEEVTEQMEQTVEAAETAAELRANISQYGLNKQAAALIYQFYGIDKVGSFVTPSVEAIDTVGRNYNAANQLMAALEEAEKGFKARVRAIWNSIIKKLQEWSNKISEFLSPVTNRLKAWYKAAANAVKKGIKFVIPNKLLKLIAEKKLDAIYKKLEDKNLTEEEAENLTTQLKEITDEIASLTKDTADKQEVEAKDTTEAGKIGQFLKWCRDRFAAIPSAISRFIQWIKSFFTKKVDTAEDAKAQTTEQKKAGKISKAWTAFTNAVRAAWNKVLVFLRIRKAEAATQEVPTNIN